MNLRKHIVTPVLVFLVVCLEIHGQSTIFGFRDPLPVQDRPSTTLSPRPSGVVTQKPLTGTTQRQSDHRTKHEADDLLSMLLRKVEEISRKQDNYQNVLLSAIKGNETQEGLAYLNTESSFLVEQVKLTTKMAPETIKDNVESTTVRRDTAMLDETSMDKNLDKRIGFSVRKAAGTNPNTYLLQASKNPLSFQDVLSNTGSGWTGQVFQAPLAGHYFFTFHAQSSETGDFTLSLRKNGLYQVTAYGGKSGYQWGSNSVLLNLNTNDTVYLTLDEGELYEHPLDEAYTTFTGFLVFQ